MNDAELVTFLRWALPQLGMRWSGFRKVRRQVGRRVARRLAELGLPDLGAYRALLTRTPAEWAELDPLCRVTISRFYRDRRLFDTLGGALLPELAAAAARRAPPLVRAWSAGCASGEEPYTLSIVWERCVAPHQPGVALAVAASDADPHLLQRARAATYDRGSLRELPEAWRAACFDRVGRGWVLRPSLRERVTFREEDIRRSMPDGPLDLVLCRYLAFTYFAAPVQRAVLARLHARMRPGAALVLGTHEAPPPGAPGFAVDAAHPCVYRRRP